MPEPALNPDLLSLLRCPRCREALAVDATDLVCQGCNARYPIVRGVPRLAGEAYAESFGRQWNRYDVARTDEDEATFEAKTGVHLRELAGLRVLDAGCGGGRYSRLVGDHGANVLGVDLSTAVDKASSLCVELPNVQIAQADLLDLPVAESAFDLVFSIGVLHHTPDPRRAFAQILEASGLTLDTASIYVTRGIDQGRIYTETISYAEVAPGMVAIEDGRARADGVVDNEVVIADSLQEYLEREKLLSPRPAILFVNEQQTVVTADREGN